jgi:hypothetical protein
MWQIELNKRLSYVADSYPIAGCFIDVTLCTFNLHNALVEGRTSSEGINDMIRMLGNIRSQGGYGLPIGGEGLNEITAQGLSFAQMHLYNSPHKSVPGLERTGGDCAVNDFILGGLCRTTGYNTLTRDTEDEWMRMRVHDDHNSIPSITSVNTAEEILNPNALVQNVLDRANA